LYSGTLGRAGIVNISGTGSITFGMNEKGVRKRAGGWGYLIGDRGSGYSIGRDALQSAFEAYDGCGKETLLTELILQGTQVQSLTDLIPSIYELGKARKVIAPLSRIVVQAADQGDEVAQRILQKAAVDMATGIECLLTQLFHDRGRHHLSNIPVVLTGGVYSRSDWFIPTIKEKLSRMNEAKIEIIVPNVPPVAGGVIAALRNLDVDVEDRFVKRLFNNGLNHKE
jgi:N-acetylglucosamine kinase-like BadF-type ATPase